jgi:hypothetical protein
LIRRQSKDIENKRDLNNELKFLKIMIIGLQNSKLLIRMKLELHKEEIMTHVVS